jgi:hypothetical protein
MEIHGLELTIIKQVAEALEALEPKRPDEAARLHGIITDIEERPKLWCQ